MIDPQDFGEAPSIEPVLQALAANDVTSYLVKKGVPINDCLRAPLSSRAPIEGGDAAIAARPGRGGRA
ncbi:MAG: hypothetical protein BZY81_08130 [SAR202 cluster bacterium Io17-Chloro-G4]|nr:MAG: hypothetical protein BZY81_08130 [SAR202 cluster bacterium Io17-Chloro-G4]